MATKRPPSKPKAAKSTPSPTTSLVASTSGLGLTDLLLPFQKRWIADNSPEKIAEKRAARAEQAQQQMNIQAAPAAAAMMKAEAMTAQGRPGQGAQ